MPGGLWYALWRNMVGSWRFRLQRLRQPKYLIGMLVVLGYFGLVFSGTVLGEVPRKPITDPGLAGVMVSLFLVFQLSLIWLLAGRTAGLGFTEAEVEILFAAPLTRKELVRYRLLKSQPPVLLSATFLVLIFSLSRKFPSPLLAWLAVIVLLNLIQAFQLLAALLHGHWRGRWWLSLVKVGGIGLLVLPLLMTPAFPEVSGGFVEAALLWAKQSAGGEGSWMAPYAWLGQFPVVASWGAWLPRLAVCGVLYGALYQWIVWLDINFEESEIAQAKQRASRVRALREGRALAVEDRPTRPAILPLGGAGAAWRAIAWKNMTSLTRHVPRSFVFAVLYILVVGGVTMVATAGPQAQPLLTASVLFLVLAMFLTVLGSSMVKEDLRSDLKKMDVLRSLPIAADDIVRGEIYGAASVMGLAVGVSLLLSAALAWLAGVAQLTPAFILSLLVFLLLLLPGIVLLSFCIENALALSFPAWILPEQGQAQAVQMDQMGRSIVLVVARLFLLLLLLLPPGLFLYLVTAGVMVLKSLPLLFLGAMGFGAIVWGETELLILWMAGMLERLDISQEGL